MQDSLSAVILLAPFDMLYTLHVVLAALSVDTIIALFRVWCS